MNTLIFSIGHLLQQVDGETQSYTFEAKPSKEDFFGVTLLDKITGNVTLMKMNEAIYVKVDSLKAQVLLDCLRCLKNYKKTIKIEELNGIFLNPCSKFLNDDREVDYFEIDTKQNKIDITEMLRQEIILHFPIESVCSGKCKGYCSVCGVNKNEKLCKCQQIEENKPLSILKSIYNGKTSSS